jgi:hypothetical protein
MSKFSSGELSKLRNDISVDILIKDILPIPSKISDGVFRFLCPICNEFQTAINPNVNLGRCFRCERNFNPIDLVIEVHGCSFKESVVFLKQLKIVVTISGRCRYATGSINTPGKHHCQKSISFC